MPTKKEATAIVVKAPNMRQLQFTIKGTAPYVQHRFANKWDILQKHQAGSTSRSKKKQEKRDIEKEYNEATYHGPKGEHGIPAAAFRSAMISACRLVGYQMTKAKLSIFIVNDFYDDDGYGLVTIKGKPKMHTDHVRLESGVASVAVRPMWKTWSANVIVNFDADQFTDNDVANLLTRAGMQVGIGEGRPDSKKSHGCGWGTFEIVN